MNKADCIFCDGPFCMKGLPGTPCEPAGCVARIPATELKTLSNGPWEVKYQPSGIKLTWKDICRICEVAAGMLGKNINEELMGRYESPQEFYEKVLEKI